MGRGEEVCAVEAEGEEAEVTVGIDFIGEDGASVSFRGWEL